MDGTIPPAEPNACGRLAVIRAQIASIARQAGRDPHAIRLVAVSKTQPAGAVASMLDCGQTIFGENRVQEAEAKFPAFRADNPALSLHLIGPLQTNKVRAAVRLFDCIDSLDRPSLADALERAFEAEAKQLRLLVQVNIGDEPQKSGIPRVQADGFIDSCCRRFGDQLQGLMCIPPAGRDPSPYFSALARMAANHGLPILSMGMSADFAIAIEAGATEIRLGSTLFGPRSGTR